MTKHKDTLITGGEAVFEEKVMMSQPPRIVIRCRSAIGDPAQEKGRREGLHKKKSTRVKIRREEMT